MSSGRTKYMSTAVKVKKTYTKTWKLSLHWNDSKDSEIDSENRRYDVGTTVGYIVNATSLAISEFQGGDRYRSGPPKIMRYRVKSKLWLRFKIKILRYRATAIALHATHSPAAPPKSFLRSFSGNWGRDRCCGGSIEK